MQYVINNLAVLSVIINTLTGGSYRNTFSARCGYAWHYERKRWDKHAVGIIDTLFFWDDLHCYHEWQNEKDSF
ncbi:tRNA pseudouridine synthase D [Vibrio phage vB_VpP_BT-1011]|uniref:tRNA pseudouridine synthase D n=1 Tax=Vibrio phage vB_VpP_BT-1011 TaxID=2799672 RepID=A0A8F2XXT3_9CAUD|nr:tRNA pseudouridine synthase D [Vibrio phage vB_VpP_BT-1011]QWX10249.1 tRNA pseudouridine synthase D [Vibrio phage vB_VpP_BT-1011]